MLPVFILTPPTFSHVLFTPIHSSTHPHPFFSTQKPSNPHPLFFSVFKYLSFSCYYISTLPTYHPMVRPIPAWTRLVASLGPALMGMAKVASILLPPPRSYDKPIPPEIRVLPSSRFRQLLRFCCCCCWCWCWCWCWCCWWCISKDGSDASVPASRKVNILGFFL